MRAKSRSNWQRWLYQATSSDESSPQSAPSSPRRGLHDAPNKENNANAAPQLCLVAAQTG
ncbi:hypothetical protein TRICHSKD4_1257 [Roseibium sp. TrichSKD4]|nr:hypothetical protein TRICHSKD4_1257 [Roseibium sp. TrichSKD4]